MNTLEKSSAIIIRRDSYNTTYEYKLEVTKAKKLLLKDSWNFKTLSNCMGHMETVLLPFRWRNSYGHITNIR